jgi:hypothetical protein
MVPRGGKRLRASHLPVFIQVGFKTLTPLQQSDLKYTVTSIQQVLTGYDPGPGVALGAENDQRINPTMEPTFWWKRPARNKVTG